MMERIQNWAVRKLSYGGRLTLIRTVLNSIFVNWGSIFILSSAFVKKLESLLNSFLWSGFELKHSKTKVGWRESCLPLKKVVWNKALVLRHNWDIFHKKDSLGIRLVHIHAC